MSLLSEYDHHSPSSLNLFTAEPAMWVLEKIIKLKQPVGIPAHRGSAVEAGVNAGLHDFDLEEKACIDVALTEFDSRAAMSGDPRREKYRDDIADMVTTALDELRRYGKPSGMQGRVENRPSELLLPILGYYDFAWEHLGILADLKTTERMPSEIKVGHARQVAHYATSDNVDARLIYVTPKKLEAYHLENVNAHRKALVRVAATVERWLTASDDPFYFIDRTIPDIESFYWKEPAARQLAYQYWGI
jgi:hypothetical protein